VLSLWEGAGLDQTFVLACRCLFIGIGGKLTGIAEDTTNKRTTTFELSI